MIFCDSSAKPVDETKSKSLGRKAVSFILFSVTGGVALSALDDLSIYHGCSRYPMGFFDVFPYRLSYCVLFTLVVYNTASFTNSHGATKAYCSISYLTFSSIEPEHIKVAMTLVSNSLN